MKMKTILLLSGLLLACSAGAAPYSVPVPGYATCHSDQVMQDLTDHLSRGDLTGDENLLRSLHFVQTCQAMLHPQKPRTLAQAGTAGQ